MNKQQLLKEEIKWAKNVLSKKKYSLASGGDSHSSARILLESAEKELKHSKRLKFNRLY